MEPMKENKQVKQHHVDTSRPFTSVKEAVATFGQRILLPGKIHALNSKPVSPITSPNTSQIAKPVSTSIGQIAKPGCECIVIQRMRVYRDLKDVSVLLSKRYERVVIQEVRTCRDPRGTSVS
ncbi:hypothetical protein YC2023_051081 [Brassica napus]